MKIRLDPESERIVFAFRAAGGFFKFDGDTVRMFGKNIPEDLANGIRERELLLKAWAMHECPCPCPACLGVGVHKFEGYYYCSVDQPVDAHTRRIARLGAERMRMIDEQSLAWSAQDLERYEWLAERLRLINEEIELLKAAKEVPVGS